MRRIPLAAAVVLLGLPLSLAPVTAPAAGSPDEELVTVLVTLREQPTLPEPTPGSTRRARVRAVLQALQATADRSQVPLRNRLAAQTAQGQVADFTPLWVLNAVSVTATPAVIQELAARPDVASVTVDDVTLVPTTSTPEPNQTLLRAPETWDLGQTGQGVVVATLDSGVDATHPDLASRWRGGTNSWFDPYGEHPGTPTDLTGHGTAVMGAIVGGDAGGTAIGTAPGATWIAAKIFDDRGGATVTAVHQAFEWLLDPDGDPNTYDAPQVVNSSWSIGTGPGCDLTFQPDLQALRAAGILPVFAAGNFGPGASTSVSPANYPEALAVGAVSNEGLVYSGSSRGPSGCGGRTGAFPDVVAPGVDIRTTDRYGLYQTATGSSMSAPHAAGALAVLLGAVPGLTADQQSSVLTGSALDLGPPGADDDYGAGLIDLRSAYEAAQQPVPDFALSLTPSQSSAEPGGVATYDVQVNALNGFAGDVILSLAGPVASQAGWSFSPAEVAGGSGSARLEVTASATAPPGDYALTVHGSSGTLDRSAEGSLTVTVPAVLDTLELSTVASAVPPGVAGPADDADLYRWDGTSFGRTVDASATPYGLPAGANVDGFDRVDASHFFVSFGADTRVRGLGQVQDEDVLSFNAGAWSVCYNLTARGLTSAGLDLDAISVVGSMLYFSTAGSTNPPGVRGIADDADVYSFDGRSFARVWDATANGLGTATNVDGLVWEDATHLHLSFSPTTTTVPGLGSVQDEDVVHLGSGTWSTYFDGTAHGLVAAGLDVDAFDLP